MELSFLDPESSSMTGDEALVLLTQTLERHDIHVGAPSKHGHEECASGIMAYGVYKHIGGQREYWIIPHEEATVFACWQMGAMTTAGMERTDIHHMLKKLHFEHTEETAPAEEPISEEPADPPEAAPEDGEGDVYVIINDVESEIEAPRNG